MTDFITLSDWYGQELDFSGTGKFNAQSKGSIEWAKYSWNPVTGCLNNCPYCYARDQANRRPWKFKPAIHPGRFSMPANTPAPKTNEPSHKNVFTCSMADLFGPWVPEKWIHLVLDTASQYPSWQFLFLTKYPERLAEFTYPDNAWVGATIDTQERIEPTENAFEHVDARVKWLSCEPLLSPLEFSRLDLFNWVILGGRSRSTKTPQFHPPREWIDGLEQQARVAGCSIYEKPNLFSGERDRLREYPQGAA